MGWAVPKFSRTQVDAAGEEFAKRQFPMLNDQTMRVINNWRSSHGFPLNTFQNNLRRTAKKFDADADVVQRIKRLEAVHNKLSSEGKMRLSQMQDIGGCRAVVGSLESARAVVECIREMESSPRFLHPFKNEKPYMDRPGEDGYRSHHLIYRYHGRGRSELYSRLQIEMQIRTQLQHQWATAVEVVGTFTKQALKSNVGDPRWIRFFSLLGTVTAAIEGCASVPGTTTSKAFLVAELSELNEELKAKDTLAALVTSLKVTKKSRNADIYVLRLNYDTRRLSFVGYSKNEREAAMLHANDMEQRVKSGQNIQVVLVAADSTEALRRAYPNYFLNTEKFAGVINQALLGQFPDPLPIWQTA